MSEPSNETTFTPPSKGALLKATLAALVVAVVLLVVAVLPAEYGVDPTGIGAATGLTQLSAEAPEEDTAGAPPEALSDFARLHDGPPLRETIEITLEEGEEVEYKALLEKGEMMLWSWSIPEGDIYFDFHGEPTEGDFEEGYFLSYGEGEASSGQGSFAAPFTGHHGWYWLNYNEETVTITLTLEGYYSDHEEMYRGQNF